MAETLSRNVPFLDDKNQKQKERNMNWKYVLGMAVASSFPFAASANIVADGNFSEGEFVTGNGGLWTTYGAGQPAGQTIGPWTVNSGSVDLTGTLWSQPPGGGYSLDMDGNNPGSIEQSVNLTAGTATVSFALASNPNGITTKTLEVDLLGLVPQTFTFDITGYSTGNMGWTDESATFNIPTSGSYTLQFSSLDPLNSVWGPASGDVSISNAAVPDGGTTAGLLGGALVSLTTLRRKLLS